MCNININIYSSKNSKTGFETLLSGAAIRLISALQLHYSFQLWCRTLYHSTCTCLLGCCLRVGYYGAIVQVERLSKGNLQKCFSDIVMFSVLWMARWWGIEKRGHWADGSLSVYSTISLVFYFIFLLFAISNMQSALKTTNAFSPKARRCM